jgi:hypothetical protein
MNAFRNVIGHSGKLNIVFGGGNSFSQGVRIKKGKARFVPAFVSLSRSACFSAASNSAFETAFEVLQ